MSTTTRILLILAVLILYFFGLLQFCSRQICEACGTNQTVSGILDNADSLRQYPIQFKYGDMNPAKGPGFDSLMAAVKAGNNDDSILEIIGLFYEDEAAPAGFETMGLARATAIRNAYFKDIPEERIRLRGRLLNSAAPSDKNAWLSASEFKWLPKQEVIPESVEEIADGAIIRFPFNSTEKEYDPKVDAYLQTLAKRVAKTGERIELTGHTDNKGEPEYNLRLGANRARQIQDLLVKLGVNADLISTASKGESLPVAPNTTEENRHNNRRVEVRLIKKQSENQ
jgi:outer membrane protein OmpA-like peptidoglycan-associated protein